MTPEDIIKNLVAESQPISGDHNGAEIIVLSTAVLTRQLQELINRSHTPISNELIAKMSALLEIAESNIVKSRKDLESLYNKGEPPIAISDIKTNNGNLS